MSSELFQKEKILQLVLDNIPSFVFWKDDKCTFLGCNMNFAISAGLNSPNEIIGKTDYDLPWRKEDSDFYRKIDKEVMNSQKAQINFEEPQTMQNGKTKWLRTSKIPLYNDENEVIGILGTYEDITSKKSMELELISRNKSLEKLNMKLAMANTDLEQFAYAASHDLQEPLRMIGGFTGLFESKYAEILDDSGIEYLNYIKEGAQRMSTMMNKILCYSNLKEGAEQLVSSNIKEIVDLIVENLSSLINEKNAIITINLPIEKINCEPEQISLLFNNLLTNGIKFNNSDSPKIKIDFKERETEWYFTVSDNGIGINEKYQDYIFKPFKRLNNREVFPGDGVGLALCKRIINIHKGQIWYTNNQNSGTVFHFTIPKFNEHTLNQN